MYRITGGDGKEYGPVSAEQLRQWVAEGRANQQTQVQAAGSTEWRPLSSFPELAALAPPVVQDPPAGVASRHQLTEFPTAVVILLHFLTCGIFSMVWLNLMHGKLPKVRADDPSAGRAVGFCFIPFYNLYWIFFTYRRLCLRIDEQRSLYGMPPSNLRGMATTACIFQVIPYINVLIGYTIISPIFFGMMQSSVNQLAKTSVTTTPRATLPTVAATPGLPSWAIALIVCGCMIPVLAILAGMLLPALSAAREKARQANCLSNLRQIGLTLAMYSDANQERLPNARQWTDAVRGKFATNDKVFQCPSDKQQHCSYVFNRQMSGAKWQGDEGAVVVVESAAADWNGTVGGPGELVPIHRQGYCVLFNDGHVEFVRQERLQQLQWSPHSTE